METRTLRRVALATGLLLAGVITLLGGLAIALDRGALRHPLVHLLSWYMGRTLVVRGPLRLHLLSAHPWLAADGVTLGNPPWVSPGDTGTAKHVELTFRWVGRLDGLLLEGAVLDLRRDTDGFANWQFRRPQPGRLPILPPFQMLKAADVQLRLQDAQRHLEFDGTVEGGSQRGAPLELTARGTLNSRPAQLSLRGGPLVGAVAEHDYPFEFTAAGSGSRVELKGGLPTPFELDLFNGSFEASGDDLKDLYFLIGLRFVHTGKFRFTGQIERRGTLTRLSRLSLSSGDSDLTGGLSVETRAQHPRLQGELHSRVLRSADIGLRAAGRDGEADPLVFSRAKMSLAGVRHVDAQLRWTAERLQIGRFVLDAVTARLTLERGVIDMPAFEGRLLGGKFNAQAHLDATRDVPPAEVRLELAQGDLQELPLNMQNPPLAGPLGVTAHLTGRGLSVHDVAASADGSVEFRVQRGSIRASIAELAGLDLRGIGLILAHSQREMGLRCAVGRFQATAGTLSAQQLVVDTDTVLIQGQGSIHLADESLDLQLRGEPKKTRLLRIASPLLIAGTLRKPTVAAQSHGASLRLIDRGRAQDVDCGAL